jgi:hypothetical protein
MVKMPEKQRERQKRQNRDRFESVLEERPEMM